MTFPVSPQQVAKIYHRLGELLAISAQHFGWKVLPAIEVRFDLKGKAAGQMQAKGKQIVLRFNPVLMAQNFDHFVQVAVGHELAHAVAYMQCGKRIQPHGKEWRAVMALFGLPPDRCHDYDTSQAQVRRLQRFRYRCGCQEHELTSIRHRRIQKGEQQYFCRQCRKPLTPVEEEG